MGWADAPLLWFGLWSCEGSSVLRTMAKPVAGLSRQRNRAPLRRGLLGALVLLALLSLALTAQTPPAAAALTVRIVATPNFGGNYQPEQWVPITVALANDGPGTSGEVVVQMSNGVLYSQRIELPTRSQKVLTMYVQAPSRANYIGVRFEAGKEHIDASGILLRELKSGQQLVGVVVDDAALGAEYTRAIVAAYGSANVEAVTVAPDEIPANTFGLGSFSALVIGDATTGRWSAEQRAALASWVGRGGQLVAAGGPNWRKTVEGLGELPPLRPTDSRTVTGLNGLGPLGGSSSGPTGQWVVATGDLLAGASRLADQDGAPLVASRGWGRGTVFSLAFDPGTSGFSNWTGTASFWRKLALDTAPPVGLQEPFGNTNNAREIVDILSDIPGLALPPTWLLGIVLLLFIVAIGPVNYLVLRYFDRRELAWATIPLLTLFFAGTIYAVGATTKGRSVVLNTVSVVRVSPGVRSAEVLAFYGIFTPSRGIRDVGVAQEALVSPFSRNGLGDVGDLGNEVRFEQGVSSAVRRASFAQWTQRTVAAQGLVDPAPLAIKAEVRWDGQKLVGTITNTSKEPIEDLLLLVDSAYQSFGTLAPGGSVTVDWRPTAAATGYSPYYQRGLGTAYYYNSGSFPGSQGSSGQSVIDHRAGMLDTLSGTVLDYRMTTLTPPGPFPPTPTPTTTATVRPSGTPSTTKPGATPTSSTGTRATRAGTGPVQVLFWRPEVPLDLRISAGDRTTTTLVIQEVLPGAATQQRPGPVIAVGEGR